MLGSERQRLAELIRRLRDPALIRQKLSEIRTRLDVVRPERHGAPVVIQRLVGLSDHL